MSFENGMGGFLGLDLAAVGSDPCPTAIAELTNGRSCFAAIIEMVKPNKVYIPWYVCPVMLEVLDDAQTPYDFYSIDEALSPQLPTSIRASDLVLLVNYFGICGDKVDALAQQIPASVVIDDAQAFFHRPPANVWAFNSARKFFGVPDGAWLFGTSRPELQARATFSTDHLEFRDSPGAYQSFSDAEKRHSVNRNRMSLLTRTLLGHTNMPLTAQRRQSNFQAMHDCLEPFNQLQLSHSGTDIPLCYPFLPKSNLTHQTLHTHKVWVARYWPDMPTADGTAWEQDMVDRLLPLPIDQRYNENDISNLCTLISGLLGQGNP